MEKTIFHFVENLISGTVTVDGNWLETGVRDFVEKYPRRSALMAEKPCL